MSEIKLLRCSCCDSDADYDELHTVSEGSDCFFCEHHSYIVRCKGCGLTLTSRTSKEDAIEKWNTRKQDAIQKIEEVGTAFGSQIGKFGVNYENGYMQAIVDCKSAFYTNSNKGNK